MGPRFIVSSEGLKKLGMEPMKPVLQGDLFNEASNWYIIACCGCIIYQNSIDTCTVYKMYGQHQSQQIKLQKFKYHIRSNYM